jgi:ATP-dependent exoDNAse (exonuclease V) alpha subunit
VGPVAATGLVTNAGDVLDMYKWMEDPEENTLPFIAKGARVMFTENVNKTKGMITSATATITDFEEDQQGTVLKITVTVDSTSSTETLARGVGRGTTITTWLSSMEYTKKVFPLRLAYAMTAHRCQGMTLRGHTVLHLRNAFAAGIAYVMLSRVPNTDNLHILGGLRPQDIVPVPITGGR